MFTISRTIRPGKTRERHGITLLELLIVITILVMVTATSIPLLLTGVEGRRMREASRLVSSYITLAKSKAIETGRPCGVMLQVSPQATTPTALFSMNLVTVEVPSPYCGDSVGSQIRIDATGKIDNFNGDSGWRNLVRVRDVIKFGYQGRSYSIVGPSPYLPAGTILTSTQDPATTPWELSAIDGSISLPPTGSTSYQIFRQPIKSAVQPLQLPEPLVVDVSNSGVGTGIFAANSLIPIAYRNPIILFSPTGSVQTLYDGDFYIAPTSMIYLLLGRREGMTDVNPNATAYGSDQKNPLNIEDLTNIWITINNQSGQVTTAENAKSAYAGGIPSPAVYQAARIFSQSGQSMGGR